MSSSSFSGWRWVRRASVGSLCVLLWLAALPIVHGQTGSAPGPMPLRASLSEAEQTLTLLVQRLAERQQQVNDLQASLQTADARLNDLAASLAILRGKLEAALESQAQSQTDLEATSSSLETLSTRYDELDKLWQTYRGEMQKQVREVTTSRNWWRAGAIAGWIAAIIAAIVAVVK
jgi:hypothetical protein